MSFLEYLNRRLRMLWWLIIGKLDEWPVDAEDCGDPAQTAVVLLVVVLIAAVLVLAWREML